MGFFAMISDLFFLFFRKWHHKEVKVVNKFFLTKRKLESGCYVFNYIMYIQRKIHWKQTKILCMTMKTVNNKVRICNKPVGKWLCSFFLQSTATATRNPFLSLQLSFHFEFWKPETFSYINWMVSKRELSS